MPSGWLILFVTVEDVENIMLLLSKVKILDKTQNF
jgi:hypothetical protein